MNQAKPPFILARAGRFCQVGLTSALLAGTVSLADTAVEMPMETLTLQEAVDDALLNNRQLQIERINPEIARFTLQTAYGFYDPIFTSQVHTESASDSGGFDPANFSADAVFEADSEVFSAGLLGFLPSGLSYTLGGNYAHSSGTRNFLNFDSHKVSTAVTLQQPLLRDFWIDQPRWLIQVNKRNLRISELGVQFVAMSVINLTRQGYHDLQFAWENLRVRRNLVATKQEFLQGIQRQIELGTVTVLEEKLARSQLATAETAVVEARNLVALASNNLRTLLGIQPTEWRDEFLVPEDSLIMVPELLDLPGSWREGLKQRPDLLQLALNEENAALTVRYRRNQLFPSLDVIGSYGLRGADAIQAFPPDDPRASRSRAFSQIEDQTTPNSMVGLLFSIPLTSTRERANYAASKEIKEQAELIVKQKQELILREIADAVDQARYSFERAEAARQAVQFAAEAVEAEEQKLRGGTGSIFFVLQAQTDLAFAKVTEIAARRDYNKALSQLYFTEGTLLERHRINFDYR